ncbi:hypothetical protein I6F21_14950 [Bradyrhizobium sp. NBAIM03]|uniref:hypothetical protein n=1 Tax=Bradyrhizobium sp. NBAIM03 TaxID=2793816 RepID=UPI001CD5D661|nr:hypothetical protein [Bradyrhizobium sp. NBAIM03]MCA1533858.1 hypothetical protein [Bradyrhizobium sp. NBAIM03]
MNAHDPNSPSGEPTNAEPEASKASAGGLMPQITLITKRDIPALMSKRISLTNDGKLRSDGSECRMILGAAARAFAGTASALAQIIESCRSDQAIALGALKAEITSSAAVTIPKRLDKLPGAITRSRECIDYRRGIPAWALVDFDTKGMPKEVRERIDAAGGMWNALLTVVPELVSAARVSRASTSAGLFHSGTGEPIPGSNGMHHYVLVRDGSDVGRFLSDLHDRCWLAGFGWHMIGGAGQLLDRSIVDRMVGFGERLCFEGAAVVVPPLAQDASKRAPVAFEGDAIRSDRVVPPLTEYERHRVNEAKAASKKALGKDAAKVRDNHDQELAEKIAAKTGMPIPTAHRIVKARHSGVLYPDVELEFDHLGIVAAGAVLAAPERYVGETLADPMEGVDYGRCKAMVMRGDDGNLIIHSFAHGRSIYRLRYDLKSAQEAFAAVAGGGTVDHAMAILARAELEQDELENFTTSLAEATGTGKHALKQRIKKERAEREKEACKASIQAEATADGQIVRERPPKDGELLPTVTFLDGVLADDQSEEPPMRNANGQIVRIEEKEPWALHLLTSDSANASGGEAEIMKPPAEPVLTELTVIGVGMLIEKHVRWIAYNHKGVPYFAALPAPFINALIEFPNSAIPGVRAINTSPLVTMSGRVIDGIGLDRRTRLVHRIDPVLRACLPAGKPTDEEIKQSLSFLLDEWLVDVALDRAGKCVAIMLALTLLQRALLPERPAFFVTAGQRGGGKTTLIIMIIAAVLGRRATAAAWSDSVEERKKALFSYLRQSVAALVWDNIARGSTISCPHIEAALTASEISDRVLGVSCVETVPATTVQIFTGNSIAPRGDMASRSFVLPLNVDRPDPENRNFEHADPVAWTQANRTKILRALYTILIGGTLQRPEGQVAKTRFKLWWGLIGWPVEYAAGLLSLKLDCTELLRSGEAGEEEASATSRVLTVLGQEWRGKWFTTRDVVMFLKERHSLLDDDTGARAEALFDALSELIGKPLENPTARSLGKLFQKHLTNRPAWIDGGHCAVLRKVPLGFNKDGNKYEVVVQTPDAPPSKR